MKRKEFVVEELKNGKWVYRSDHKNLLSAEANFEALVKISAVRLLQNGKLLMEGSGWSDKIYNESGMVVSKK